MTKTKMTKTKGGAFWHAEYLAKQWELYTPPAVPSKNECQIIEQCISKHRKPAKVLILGATPQFRDLAHRQKAEVTCVDIAIDMILAMTKLMKYQKKTEKEIWFRANWLTMPLTQNYFDFVLGDLVLSNIPLKLQPKFLAKIKEVLKPGGYFITRHHLPILPPPPVSEIVDKVIDKKHFNKAEIIGFTWDVLCSVYKLKDNSMSTDDMYLTVRKIWQKEKNTKRKKQITRLIQFILSRYPAGKTWWTLPKKFGEKLIEKYFKIVAVKYGTDHPRAFHCPIYFLKK